MTITNRQINYINDLLEFTYQTHENLESLSKAEASALIDNLVEEQHIIVNHIGFQVAQARITSPEAVIAIMESLRPVIDEFFNAHREEMRAGARKARWAALDRAYSRYFDKAAITAAIEAHKA